MGDNKHWRTKYLVRWSKSEAKYLLMILNYQKHTNFRSFHSYNIWLAFLRIPLFTNSSLLSWVAVCKYTFKWKKEMFGCENLLLRNLSNNQYIRKFQLFFQWSFQIHKIRSQVLHKRNDFYKFQFWNHPPSEVFTKLCY